MNDIDIERIKGKFYTRLREEEKLKSKRAKLNSIALAAAVVCLTGATVFAANLGALNTLFSNFNDVSNKVQSSNEEAKSNGITMRLSSYLADPKGIIPELVFIKNDGSVFASDTMAISDDVYRPYAYPSIKINNIRRVVYPKNIVSDDGRTFYCMPIIHYDIEKITNVALDISVDKLIYDVSESNETIDFDLYDVYKKASIKILDNVDSHNDLQKLFEDIKDNPVQTEAGVTIGAIVFAKVKETPTDTNNSESDNRMPPADGVDLGGLYSHQYNNIVAIKYSRAIEKDGVEYYFEPVNLKNNKDPLGIGLGDNGDSWYHFFRVSDFEDLKNMNGFDFIVNSNKYIKGKWHIKTSFAANQDLCTVDINKIFNMEDLSTTLTLAKADISLLSTKLSYEVKDSEGNLVTNINGYDMNVYYFKRIFENEIKLRYGDGSEISLVDCSFTGGSDGVINISYNVEMNPDNYTLMNTNKLSAIVVNGECFEIE